MQAEPAHDAREADRALEWPALEDADDQAGGKRVSSPRRLDDLDRWRRHVERRLGSLHVHTLFAELDHDRAGAAVEEGLRLAHRVVLAGQRARLVVVRDEIVGEREQLRDGVDRQLGML